MGFWDHIKQWLNKEEGMSPCSPCAQPISQELINRSDEELQAFEKWKLSKCKPEMLQYIANNYEIWKIHPANNVMELIL